MPSATCIKLPRFFYSCPQGIYKVFKDAMNALITLERMSFQVRKKYEPTKASLNHTSNAAIHPSPATTTIFINCKHLHSTTLNIPAFTIYQFFTYLECQVLQWYSLSYTKSSTAMGSMTR
jgi:hypothetical protein